MVSMIIKIYSYFRYADQVAIGDEVLVQGNGEFTPEKVLNMSQSMMEGDCNFFLSYLSVLYT